MYNIHIYGRHSHREIRSFNSYVSAVGYVKNNLGINMNNHVDGRHHFSENEYLEIKRD